MIALLITAALVCAGVGFTCYGIGLNRGWCDALNYFSRRAVHNEGEDNAA